MSSEQTTASASGPSESSADVDASGPASTGTDQTDPEATQLAAAEAFEDGQDLAGQTISGRYLVEGCLGSGAMGTVWRAEHTLMKKTVALKVLNADAIGHGEMVERFRREAQAAAHIDHPNVCVATDFGELDATDGFFLVMEYLEGNTLDERLVCVDRFEADRAIHIVDQVLAALQQADQLGVVHRDLKPENIMLVHRDGDPDCVKIMDFGVARVRIGDDGADAKLTRAGRVYGTPMYMSPEQAAGAEDVDHRADLYSVGVILFEMLTGQVPFVDQNPAKVMAMHMTAAPPSLRDRLDQADVDRDIDDLDRVVGQLMAKAPEDRPSSARQVRAQLEAVGRTDASSSKAGSTARWVARGTRRVADRGTSALRSVAAEVTPGVQRLGDWVAANVVVRGSLVAVVALALLGALVSPVVYLAWPADGAETAQARRHEADILAAERQHYLDDIDAGGIVGSLAMGDAGKAVDRLDELIANGEPNAHLYFLQGRANVEVGHGQRALQAYRQALELDRRYASDDRLVDDVVERYVNGSDDQIDTAEAILLDQLPAATGNRRLSKLARLGEHSAARRRARDSLKASGRLSELDDWNRASIALRFAHGCSEHRRRIEAIVDADDPRGLAVLRYYERQPPTGCGSFDRDDCYGCIRKDLDRAISALSGPNDTADERAQNQPVPAAQPSAADTRR